ncbi:MAG: hypothetical protein D6751_02130 [Deltaproteobacteria bacterium]|nr:MAG: hypothetical protein D6751_02130 [Deltaproteobacteria bacterium]
MPVPEGFVARFLDVVVTETGRMWWIFLLSVLLVGLIKGYKLDLHIRDFVRRSGPVGILLAVLVGMVSPLCACGILPVVISLAMVGTPLAPLLALLATSPTMGPDALLLTWRGLGGDWALIKLVGSGILGLAVGWATLYLQARGWLGEDEIRLEPVYREDGSLAPASEIGAAAGIRVKSMQVVPRAHRLRFIFDRCLDAGLFTGKYLLLAIVLEGLLVTLVPTSWIAGALGRQLWSPLVAAVVGLPLPANQIPMIPILAGLLERGMDMGAGTTLLLAGPVSSLPAMVALAGIFRRRVLVVFLSVSLAFSLAAGLLVRLLT